jgi:hypothetical protein
MNRARTIAVLAATLLYGAAPVWAMPSTVRMMDGIIVAVEPATRRLTLQCAGNQKRLVLTWDHRTVFHRDSVVSESGVLKAGQIARVGYRLPLFGPDYASRVVLLPAAALLPKTASSRLRPRHRFLWSSKSKYQRQP